MRIASVCLVLMLAFTFSCAPMVIEGRKIDAARVKQLVAGETNVNKVVELLGTPTKAEKLPNGDLLYVYTYSTEEPHWWMIDGIDSQRLEITLRNGVVIDHKFTQREKEAILKQ